MPEWFTPPQIARARGVKPAKVLAWIASGELEAVNHASTVVGRPRWRVSAASLEAFDRARSNRLASVARARPCRSTKAGVIQFF